MTDHYGPHKIIDGDRTKSKLKVFNSVVAAKRDLKLSPSTSQPHGTIPPIAFASHTLPLHEKNYGISDWKNVVVRAVKHF